MQIGLLPERNVFTAISPFAHHKTFVVILYMGIYCCLAATTTTFIQTMHCNVLITNYARRRLIYTPRAQARASERMRTSLRAKLIISFVDVIGTCTYTNSHRTHTAHTIFIYTTFENISVCIAKECMHTNKQQQQPHMAAGRPASPSVLGLFN